MNSPLAVSSCLYRKALQASFLCFTTLSCFMHTAHAQQGLVFKTTPVWQTPSSGSQLLSQSQYTPLSHYRGSTYFVWVDAGYRPWVTKITDGRAQSVPLDNNPDYIALADGHNRFSLGIDKDGYLHITGDMHNYSFETVYNGPRVYPQRYQKQAILYWKSKDPESLDAGFAFAGGKDAATALPGAGWSYGRFFTDNYGELYYSARVKAIYSRHTSGEMGLGLYKYDASQRRWTALGGRAEDTRPGIYYPVVLWENAGMAPNQWYQGFLANMKFDAANRLHLAASINTDPSLEGSNRIIYATSNDGGASWLKANGSKISKLPIRGAEGLANQGDVVAATNTSPFFDSKTKVIADKHGRPAVINNGQWYAWDGSQWNTQDNIELALNADLNADGNLLLTSYSKIMHSESVNSTRYGHDITGYQSYESVDEYALKNQGVVYGVGINNNVQTILKTTMERAPLPCGWTSRDIASSAPYYGGSAGYTDGAFVTSNYGVSIDGTHDSFQFVYKKLEGSGTITARISVDVAASAHARTGVMMRESLAYNAKHVTLSLVPGKASALFNYRKALGEGTSNFWTSGINAPYWVRLDRDGNTFTAFVSKDGSSWEQTGKLVLSMPETIYVGLSSASYSRSGILTSRFERVNAPALQPDICASE